MNYPLEIPERFPEPNVRGINRKSARAFVCGIQIFTRSESSDRGRAAETPRSDAEPAQILHRIAALSEFPIEHAAHAVIADD